jgi:hypothetical protein
LLEHARVKICLGGHKHTYTCTYPVREFYFYDNGNKNSLEHGPMKMSNTLENDDVIWTFIKNDNNLI